MKALTLALAALISLTALPTDARRIHFHNVITIDNNLGGEIGHFARQAMFYRNSGAQIRIRGACASACTMFLGLPGACVYPWARIGFHQARDVWGNPSPIGTWDMVRYYPPYLAAIAAQMPIAPGLMVVSGMDLIRLGARPCIGG